MIHVEGSLSIEHEDDLIYLTTTSDEIKINFPNWKSLERGYQSSSFFSLIPDDLMVGRFQLAQPIEVYVEGKARFNLIAGKPSNYNFKTLWKLMMIWLRVKVF